MKKKLAALITLLVMLSVLILPSYAVPAITVSAEIPADRYLMSPQSTVVGSGLPLTETELIELSNLLSEGALQCEDSCDISRFDIPNTPENASMVVSLASNNPELFHITGYRYGSLSGKIASLQFTYNLTKTNHEENLGKCKRIADELLQGISVTDLGQANAALLVHDRLAVHCQYDAENYATNPSTNDFTMLGALWDGVAVCQGYTMAYIYLLDQLGIESRPCSSEAMNHVWNIVTVDNVEYHVDVTWDDPMYDITGRVKHKNFLRSSTGIYETGHNSSDYDTSPDDTRYDNHYWNSSDTEFQYIDDKIYYIDSVQERLVGISDGVRSVLASVDDTWTAPSGGVWQGNYARLSSSDGVLYYNNGSSIYSYDPQVGRAAVIYTPVMPVAGYQIYGFTAKKDAQSILNFYINTYNSPNFELDTVEDYQLVHPFCIHNWVEASRTDATCTEAGVINYVCSIDATHTKTEPIEALGHDWDSSFTVDVAPTCEVAGSQSLHCSRCDEKKLATPVAPLGHDWTETGRTDATCTEAGVISYVCSRDATHTKTEPIVPLGHGWTETGRTDATCTVAGVISYVCSIDATHTKTEPIVPLGHDWTETGRTDSTCTETGIINYVCSHDETHTNTEIIEKKQHDFDAGTYNDDATFEEDGTRTFVCSVCQYTETRTQENSKLTDTSKKFNDVPAAKWYKSFVDYAVTHKLFNGTSDTTFAPDTAMNRAMFVQVLANLNGIDTEALRGTATKFTDVPAGKWYTGAVKWANDNGIVSGVSETEFAPTKNINRQEMCTMLYRYAMEYGPEAIAAVTAKVEFDDDADISNFARTAVYACQQAGLINGMTATEFAPKGVATRGQVAKILSVFHRKLYM